MELNKRGLETCHIFKYKYISSALHDTYIVQKENDPAHFFVLFLNQGSNILEQSKINIKLEIYYCFV